MYRITAAISHYSVLAGRLRAVEVFIAAFESAENLQMIPSLSLLTNDGEALALSRCLSDSLAQRPKHGQLMAYDEDVDHLLTRACAFGQPSIFAVLIPVCQLVINNMGFIARLSSNLHQEVESGWLSLSTMQKFTEEVVTFLVEELRNHCVYKEEDGDKIAKCQPPTGSPIPMYRMSTRSRAPMSPEAFTSLLRLCNELNLPRSTEILLLPLMMISRGNEGHIFPKFVMPILESLTPELIKNPSTIQHYQK